MNKNLQKILIAFGVFPLAFTSIIAQPTFSGTGKVTATNPESLGSVVGTNIPSSNNIWRMGESNKSIDLNFSISTGGINLITAQIPATFSFGSITTFGAAFETSTVVLNGNDFTVAGVNLTSTSPGVVQINGVTIPTPSGASLGKFNPIISTGDDFGPLATIPGPYMFVTVPIANIRNPLNLTTSGGFKISVLNDSAAIEGYSQIPSQAYASSNNTFNSLQIFIRDNSGALSIFRPGKAYPGVISTGTGIIVKGLLSAFNSSNQLTVTVEPSIILTGSTLPVPPIVKTISELMASPEAYEGHLVTILNVSLSTVSNAWPSNTARTLNITDDAGVSNTNLRISYVTSIPGLVFPTTSPQFPSDITGIFSQNNFATGSPSYAANPFGYQLIPLKISDFKPTVITSNGSGVDILVENLVYPNPMIANELYVNTNSAEGLKVYDGVGMEVPVLVSQLSATLAKINFPETSSGLYYVTISGQNKPKIVKVIK